MRKARSVNNSHEVRAAIADGTDALQVYRFMRAAGVSDYGTLVDRSMDHEWFYPKILEHLDLEWPVPFEQVVDLSSGPSAARWFTGGKTNATWLAVDRWLATDRADDPALICSSEDGSASRLSFRQLAAKVARTAAGLEAIGVEPGDRVALFAPMIEEAAVGLLAIARMGAVAVPCFSGYGAQAIEERLNLSRAKVMICAGGAMRGGRRIPMYSTAAQAARRAVHLRTVVVIGDVSGSQPELATGQNRVGWDELQVLAGDRGPGSQPPLFDPDHPLLIAFTSGTSGRPKGAIHTHGGLPYRGAIDMALLFDVGPADRVCWVTDMGWIMGPFLVMAPMTLGATTVLVDGLPSFPSPDRMWRLVEAEQISQLGVSPSFLRSQADLGVAPSLSKDASLRLMATTGEVLTTSSWEWVRDHVRSGAVPLINYSGGTEVGCGILAGSPASPVAGGRFAGPNLGIDAAVLGDDGHRLVDEVGELVVRQPWPSMTRGLWGNDNRFESTYWSTFPGMWRNGDRAIEHADGSWEIVGRSDDVMKLSGKRVGPSEVEAIAMSVRGVKASAAVGLPDPIKGEALVVVITRHETDQSNDDLEALVSSRIAAGLGKAIKPAVVRVVPELPVTASGKIVRRAVRDWCVGGSGGDLSTLQNPDARIGIVAALSAEVSRPTE
ncbi:MAG: AMP-binding protein [Nocardioides sp.]|uniref:AMP-binding protein n=1 Tax=Nocardioides sp. TaxID=35761 RepID=UPI0039E496BF